MAKAYWKTSYKILDPHSLSRSLLDKQITIYKWRQVSTSGTQILRFCLGDLSRNLKYK